MEAGKKNISEIFNRGHKLKIPHFQRAYVWGEEQWDRFLDDLEYASRVNDSYFMGSVILKQQLAPMDQYSTRTIVDGQQRLTTIILFFRAYFELKDQLDVFKQIFTTFTDEVILEHNFIDMPVFRKVFKGEPVTANEKKSKIWKCYHYFLENMDTDKINHQKLLSNILFVGIELQNNEDEQQIFDTINSLGVRLTTAELLKNYLFSDNIDSYNQNWRDVFEVDSETREYWDQDVTSGRNIRSNIDLFLQSYLYIKILNDESGVTTEDKERYFKIDSVFNSYKEFISKYKFDVSIIISEIKSYASVYRASINPKIVEQEVKKDDYTQRINLVMFGMDSTTLIPYVLYIAKNLNDESDRNKIYQYLETYVMRRLICRNTAKNYNQLFRSLINSQIDTVEKLQIAIENKSEKINKMPSDKDLQDGVTNSVLSNKQSKGILYLIEKSIRSDLQQLELKYFDEYSLEHVMPKKWRNHWGEANLTNEQKDERDKLLLTLGNLTLLTRQLNSSIRDADWATKKNGNGRNPGLSEYASGIEIFNSFLQLDEWTEDVIKERAVKLYEYAVNKVWKIDSLDQ